MKAKKAKVFWAMKASKDKGEDFYDPERSDNIFGKKSNVIGTV